jgi:hypothetical protein
MPEATTIVETWAQALDQRAAWLARLLESHPALHLLAEYEAVFLDRRPCADRMPRHTDDAARDLLARMDSAITALEAITGGIR